MDEVDSVEDAAEEDELLSDRSALNSAATPFKELRAASALPLGQTDERQDWIFPPSLEMMQLMFAKLLSQSSLFLDTWATQASKQAGGAARAVPVKRANTVAAFIFVNKDG